MFGAKLKIQ